MFESLKEFKRFRSPKTQIVQLGLAFFLIPGMFNALNGLGAGGQVAQQADLADDANVALYTTFSVFAFFAGIPVNMFGPRVCMGFAGLGYALYSAAFLTFNYTGNRFFVIASGSILGLCAAILWTGQGAIMMSYPREDDKGKYIGWFWAVFNTGAVVGSFITFGINYNNAASAVSNGTYITFIVLMLSGCIVAFLMADPNTVVYDNGTKVVMKSSRDFWSNVKGVFTSIRDWRIMALFPMFFVSNFFYAYQFADVNSAYFNVRTRAFNSVWYWGGQIAGSALFGLFLDNSMMNRRLRGLIGLLFMFVIFNSIYIGGFFFQLQFTRDSPSKNMDFTDSGYAGPVILYMFYGTTDAIYQTYAYWIMGALSNNPEKLANYAGFYKSMQSAGAAITFRIDALKTPFLTQEIMNWVVIIVSLFPAIFVACAIKDHNPDDGHIEPYERDQNIPNSIQLEDKELDKIKLDQNEAV